MTLSQLRTLRDDPEAVVNVSGLSRAIGKSRDYLSKYLSLSRELPEDVQADIDRALAERGVRYDPALV